MKEGKIIDHSFILGVVSVYLYRSVFFIELAMIKNTLSTQLSVATKMIMDHVHTFMSENDIDDPHCNTDQNSPDILKVVEARVLKYGKVHINIPTAPAGSVVMPGWTLMPTEDVMRLLVSYYLSCTYVLDGIYNTISCRKKSLTEWKPDNARERRVIIATSEVVIGK